LFNWFEARHIGGSFLLRIEDTDASRTREEWIDAIGDTLGWLGIDWDEPPVRQSTRADAYLAAAEQLLASGHAYETFETPEELEAINAERKEAKLPPGYDGRGRELTPEQRKALAAEGRPRTIRFRTPDTGTSSFVDLVRGPVSVEWATISDFVIVRSDGKPLFFLANAVDDIAMGITHVIRGEDLLDTTHRVLALRAALGDTEPPEYAHLPLILRADRAKLSKRHGAVAVEDFRARGILPEALLNYLALLGWSPGDDREVMTRDEIVASFSLEHVTKSAAVFDEKKLEWMNGEWIRRLDRGELAARVRPLMIERYGAGVTEDLLDEVVAIAQERATTLVSIVEQSDFLFVTEENFSIDDDAWQRVVNAERGRDVLNAAIAHVEKCDWTVDAIDLRPAISDLGMKPGKVMFVLYAATEGRAAGLPVFDSIHLLGRERALGRLRAARERLA
jgi:glutamyl-tRNA synthetase